ncbi:hypothetical protein MKX03_030350 [Papaver bracteatum]|nr:hypothetical protein MKX03_030350 [Papaver bracteatum]
MLNIKNTILRHVRVVNSTQFMSVVDNGGILNKLGRTMCVSSAHNSSDKLMDRVMGMVKKFGGIDSAMVTETASFQKDLSLDSLDRTELVMAFEQEFSIEIPDEVADKLNCCADVAKYIESTAEKKIKEN